VKKTLIAALAALLPPRLTGAVHAARARRRGRPQPRHRGAHPGVRAPRPLYVPGTPGEK